MALFLIIALVVALYLRTLNYNYVIDDNVKRGGYMYEVPLTGPPPDHWMKKPSKLYRLFVIGMHCVNTAVIYLLWGWAPALIFAVHPAGVWGTAWITGNYYATTTYFCLIAYYVLTVFPNAYGAIVAMILFDSALNSTICSLTFPFLFLFIGTPWGLTLFFPLAMFLRGRRFTTGIKTRLDFNKEKPVNAKFTWRRLIVMTKVLARYIYSVFVPEKHGFFGLFGRRLYEIQALYDRMHSANKEFWVSLLLVSVTAAVGFVIHPTGTFWFFGIMLLHSQWNLTGQFFAQRYLYLPIVGLCVVVGSALQPYPVLVAIVATYLAYKTHKFIPAWRNQQEIWKNDVVVYPDNPQVYNNLAQWYLNTRQRSPDGKIANLHPWRINEIASLLQRAQLMDPNAWEIAMNLACFSVMTGDVSGGLGHTQRAIELLLPFSGGSGQYPLSKLREQEVKIKEELEKQKQKAGSASLSRPPEQKKEEGNECKSNKEKTEGVLEPCGT